MKSPHHIAELKKDNELWTPQEMLQIIQQRIESREITADSCLVILINNKEVGKTAWERYKCNMQVRDEVYWLHRMINSIYNDMGNEP